MLMHSVQAARSRPNWSFLRSKPQPQTCQMVSGSGALQGHQGGTRNDLSSTYWQALTGKHLLVGRKPPEAAKPLGPASIEYDPSHLTLVIFIRVSPAAIAGLGPDPWGPGMKRLALAALDPPRRREFKPRGAPRGAPDGFRGGFQPPSACHRSRNKSNGHDIDLGPRDVYVQ